MYYNKNSSLLKWERISVLIENRQLGLPWCQVLSKMESPLLFTSQSKIKKAILPPNKSSQSSKTSRITRKSQLTAKLSKSLKSQHTFWTKSEAEGTFSTIKSILTIWNSMMTMKEMKEICMKTIWLTQKANNNSMNSMKKLKNNKAHGLMSKTKSIWRKKFNKKLKKKYRKKN